MDLSNGDQRLYGGSEGHARIDNHCGSGRESPLSVSELPRTNSMRRDTVNTAVSDDGMQVAGDVKGLPDTLSTTSPSPVAEWPRRRPRNAVSRVGYLNDVESEVSAGMADEKRVQKHPGDVGDSIVILSPKAASSSHLSPTRTPSTRGMTRQRVQHIHLAVPTTLGHVRPRAKTGESPREPPATPSISKPCPAALSRMASRQESIRGPSDQTLRSRAPSQQHSMSDMVFDSASQLPSLKAHDGQKSVPSGRAPSDNVPSKMRPFGQEHSSQLRVAEDSGLGRIVDDGGITTNVTFSPKADVGRAAAEQLRQMGVPSSEDATGAHRDIVEARKEQNGGGGALIGQQDLVERQQRTLAVGSTVSYRLRVDNGDTESYTNPASGKAMAEHYGNLPSPTPPTAPPRDGHSPSRDIKGNHEAGDSESSKPNRMPQNIHETLQELNIMLEIEEQRRASAIASRARSRIISRAEGNFDQKKLEERANVASAAAEQLRKMATATGQEDRKAAPFKGGMSRREAATKIQAVWRGRRMRVWVTAARVIACFTKISVPCNKMEAFGTKSAQRVKVTM